MTLVWTMVSNTTRLRFSVLSQAFSELIGTDTATDLFADAVRSCPAVMRSVAANDDLVSCAGTIFNE